LEPYNFNAHYQLGLMYQYLERFAEAITAYQKAVEIRPLDPEANMNLAMTYTEMGQPLRGLPYAQRAVQGSEETPNSATSYANLGTLYAQ
jgi:Flp pilus assembly protein TadD